MITIEDIKNNEHIKIYIQKADEALGALGYTEHSFAHVGKVAYQARELLLDLGFAKRQGELAYIAGYMHDIGNIVNRVDHAQSGAIMAFRILDKMGGDPEEIATIISAIGNHDESTAVAVNPIAAALIIADKTDVRRSRVRNQDRTTFDIHDRVNYAVEKAELKIHAPEQQVLLSIQIDTEISSVMDYFEIFLQRMLLCRKAAEKLNLKFKLAVNEQMIM